MHCFTYKKIAVIALRAMDRGESGMISKNYPLSGRYYRRIIQLTSAAVLFVIVILSFSVYLNAQRILLLREYESNRKVFDQVKINIDMMDTMAVNLCKFLYMNSDVKAILYAKTEAPVETALRINRVVRTSIAANPYVHSVTMYNSYLNQFYNAGSPIFFDDQQLIEIMNGNSQIPMLKAVSRNIPKLVNGQTHNENVFSYFIYDIAEKDGAHSGAVAVNVRTDWFLENIRQINMIEKGRGEDVFVLNAKNEFIEVNHSDENIKEWLKNEFNKRLSNELPAKNVDFYESSFDGVDYLVTYSYIESMNITILKVQKLKEVFKSINHLRNSIIIISLVLTAVAFFISTGVSKKIYTPVQRLVQMVSKDIKDHNSRCVDEISYLSDFCKSTIKKLEMYDKERYLNKNILKQYWLNRLLKESHTIYNQNMKKVFEQFKITLFSEEKFAVCILKIDYYQTFAEEYESEDLDLLRFAVINISSEVVGRKYKNEGIDLKEDLVALIVGLPANDENSLNNIAECIKESQKYINKYFNLSVSASISHISENAKSISSLYNEAFNNISYRIKFGYACVISPETIKENIVVDENTDKKIKELELQLEKCILSADLNKTAEVLKGIFDAISLLDYEHLLISLINTASIINNSFYQLKAVLNQPIYFDFRNICQCIMEKETLSEIYDVMMERIKDILEIDSKKPVKTKNACIANAAKEIIHKNYQDSNLSLTMIAEILNISTRRLSKIFKGEMNVSISDYINDVRLEKAAELLSTTSMSVKKVVESLGIDNETYFYGLFKKKYGLTPKEYALRRIIKLAHE